jgi:probable rRNA maturation factor
MDILIANRQRTKKINSRRLKQIVSALLAELKIERAELGINLVSSQEMARVNQQFLQHEGSTDVITFDHRDVGQASRLSQSNKSNDGDRRDACPTVYGELYICMGDAVSQALEVQTSWQSEIVRYIVHGTLHLLGHDDRKPALRRKMKREENRLLLRLAKRFSLAELSRTAKIIA